MYVKMDVETINTFDIKRLGTKSFVGYLTIVKDLKLKTMGSSPLALGSMET